MVRKGKIDAVNIICTYLVFGIYNFTWWIRKEVIFGCNQYSISFNFKGEKLVILQISGTQSMNAKSNCKKDELMEKRILLKMND